MDKFPQKSVFFQNNSGVNSGSAYILCDCPECKTINWVWLGNMNDQTAPDRDGFNCFNCKNGFFFSELERDMRKDMDGEEYFDCAYFEEGKKEKPDWLKEF